MGREIRRIPTDWTHPRNDDGVFVPDEMMTEDDYTEEWREYGRESAVERHMMTPGMTLEHAEVLADQEYEAKMASGTLFKCDPNLDPASGWAMYENVSEGTPASPTFATREGIVAYLSKEKNYFGEGPMTPEGAEQFVAEGWAPSLVFEATPSGKTEFKQGIDEYM